MTRKNGTVKGFLASRDGIEAASKTYIKCMNAIADAADIEPVVVGGAPRESFEQTVTKLRALLCKLDDRSKEARQAYC